MANMLLQKSFLGNAVGSTRLEIKVRVRRRLVVQGDQEHTYNRPGQSLTTLAG